MSMLTIHWAHLDRLYYFYMIIPLCFILFYGLLYHQKQRRKLVADTYLAFMFKHYSPWKKYIKKVLILMSIVCILIAFLQPQWGKQEQSVMQEGRDIIIALDISRSMLAQDVKPNRLQFAKEKIKKLLYNLSCERVSLIVFSGSTIVQCPLTTDYSAFFMFLDQLDIDTISQGSTAIDQAMKEALKIFEAIAMRKTKLLVTFTDGEDFSTDLHDVKKRAQKEGLSLFTVGVGTSLGAPIPILNEKHKQIGWEKDEQGNVIMSKLNEKLLKDIARQSGGKYIHAHQLDDEDIHNLIASINKFEKDKFEDKTFSALQEQYPYVLVLALICLGCEWIL